MDVSIDAPSSLSSPGELCVSNLIDTYLPGEGGRARARARARLRVRARVGVRVRVRVGSNRLS